MPARSQLGQFFVLHAPYDLAGRSDLRPQDNDLKIALGRVGPPKHLRNVTLGQIEDMMDEIILP